MVTLLLFAIQGYITDNNVDVFKYLGLALIADLFVMIMVGVALS
jgi:hypothetical protein